MLPRRRTFVPVREDPGSSSRGEPPLDARTWWVLGGRTGAGRLGYVHVDLRRVQFAAADLTSIVLHDAMLAGASFEATRLDGADLLDCVGADIDFRAVSLRRAVIQDCHLERAAFGGADLSGAKLLDSKLCGGSFAGTTWTGAIAKRVDLRRCTFTDAVLDGAVLVDCDLRGARFGRGSVSRARLLNCELDGSTWTAIDRRELELTDCRGVMVCA